METKGRGLSIHSSQGKAAVTRQWWQPEEKDKEKDGATCPAALPTRRSLWELCSKLKKRCGVMGSCGFPHWLPRVKLSPHPVPTFLSDPPSKAPRHRPCHPYTPGQVFEAHQCIDTLFKGKLSWERSQGSRGSCAPQSQQTGKSSYRHHKDTGHTCSNYPAVLPLSRDPP